MDIPNELATTVVDVLEEKGITKTWELKKLPDTILDKWFTVENSLQEYLACVNVRDTLLKWESSQEMPSTDS